MIKFLLVLVMKSANELPIIKQQDMCYLKESVG